MNDHRQRVPSSVDTTTPSIARTYDACLDGKDNFEVDREVLDQVQDVLPGFKGMARENRNWLIRVVHWLAYEAGIDQFLDVGSGLPTAENTHEAAQRVNPEATVVYVDIDPSCDAFGKALLEENERTHFVGADLTRPVELLNDPEIKRRLDFDRPLALIQCSTLHHVSDEQRPDEVMAQYRQALPPGSYLALSHAFDPADGGHDTQLARGIEKSFLDSGFGTVTYRPREALEGFFGDFEMVEPGIELLTRWWPSGPRLRPLEDGDRLMAGGVGRKP